MKDSKKIFIIIISLIIVLIGCLSITLINKNNKSNNIIDIDCIGDDCNKIVDDKKDTVKDEDKDKSIKDEDVDSNKNTTNQSNGTVSDSGVSGNGSNSSGGTGTSNGTTPGYGTGPGPGFGPGDGNTSSEYGYGSTTNRDTNPGEVIVSDSTNKWSSNTSLKIFNVDSIAPGDNGSYEFMVNNTTPGNVIYDIIFNEDNEYSVNLKYKLKMNDRYIAGDDETWVYYNELNLKDKVLNSKYADKFYLEWKWVDAENDITVGKSKDATYKVNVNVLANSTTLSDNSGSGSFNPNTGDDIIFYIELFALSLIAILYIASMRKKYENN